MARRRKLSTEILLVFLFLIAVSSSVIITFTYWRNNKLIRKLAEGTIDRLSIIIVQKIECMLNDLAILPKSGASFQSLHPNETIDGKLIYYFLLNNLQTHPNLYAYYVATPDGKAIIVFNLNLTSTPSLFNHTAKPVPKEAAYAGVYVDANPEKPTETLTFFNKELKPLDSSGPIYSKDYDPRKRPWYIEAKKAGKLIWTDVFLYEPTKDLGIAVALPIYDDTGKLVCIFGADLSLTIFEKFLEDQKGATSISSYILDKQGKVILPADMEGPAKELAAEAFAQHQEGGLRDFSFTFQGVKYLSAVYAFPKNFGKDWYILIIDPIRDYFSSALKIEHQVVLISIAIFCIAALLAYYLAKHISAPIVILSHEVDKITHFELDSEKRVESDIQEIAQMDYSIADLRNAIRAFSRYAPKEIVKELMLKGKDIVLGGEKKEITILFSDIEEFTPIAETFPIETVNTLLAEYFDLLSKIILENRGTIDKYIGDSIMAFWGAPHEMADQASRACLTALLGQAELAKLNQKRLEKKLPPFYTRMGINTGNVIVGNIGTSERMNYTVIGDAVNAAARIQVLNKVYHTKILITEEVVAKIGNAFLIRPIDVVELRGKKKKIKVYELMALIGGNSAISAAQEQIELAENFTRAYTLYEKGQLLECRDLLQQLLKKYPQDHLLTLYLERLKKY